VGGREGWALGRGYIAAPPQIFWIKMVNFAQFFYCETHICNVYMHSAVYRPTRCARVWSLWCLSVCQSQGGVLSMQLNAQSTENAVNIPLSHHWTYDQCL